ncbi:MAG TPA: DUF6174 domain-containing protein [Pirellulales bacterium]|nr:DUF6174 domain-containing protein [Pirellulales bacterium]
MEATTGGRRSSNGARLRPRRSRLRTSALVLGVAGGLAVGLAGLLLFMILKRGPTLPEITRAGLAVAEQKWNAAQPPGYDMDIVIGGRQPGEVHIEVRRGTVTKMTRDGVTPSQSRTWEYWTVPEQFETIRQDFDSSETEGGFGAAPGAQTILKGEFDPQYGYPRRYERHVLGTDLTVEWTVTRFAPVE